MAEKEQVVKSNEGECGEGERTNNEVNNDTSDSPVGSPPRKIIRLEDLIEESDLSQAKTVSGQDISMSQEKEEGEVMSSRSSPVEKAISDPANSKSPDVCQSVVSESPNVSSDEEGVEKSDKSTSSSSSEDADSREKQPPLFRSIFDDDVTIPCAYMKFGCPRTFLYPMEFKEHVQGGCKYSVLYNCRDQQLHHQTSGRVSGTSKAKFQSLDSLVQHTSQRHGVPNVLENDGSGYFRLGRDFFEDRTQGDDDVNAKIIGQAEIKDNDDEYRVAFFLISSWHGIKDKKVYLVPVLHGQGELMDHCVLIKCSVRGIGTENIAPITGLGEPRLNIGLCQGVGRPERFFHDMKILDVLSYDKKVFMENGRVGSDDKLEYDLFISLDPYRVKIKRESGLEPRKYSINIPQLKLGEAIQQDLIENENVCELPAIAQVLIPQLHFDADLIIESHDQLGLFATFYSALMSYAIITRTDVGPWRCIAIVMFPTSTLLKKAENAWKEKGAKFGVLVSTLPSDNEVIIEKLQLHGTEILLTTPYALQKALEKKKDLLSYDLVCRLNFVVLFDADKFCERMSTIHALQECMAKIESSAKKNLVRVAVSPVVNQHLVSFLYSHGFSYSCNIFSVGKNPAASISAMEMEIKYANRITYKRQTVLQILRKHACERNRWIIFAVEDPVHCPGHLKALLRDLRLIYQGRVSCVETEEEMEANPNAFDPFLVNRDGILVTGYFALANNSIKVEPNVLMHTLPCSKADLRRVAELVAQSGDPKPFYGLSDRYSRNFANEKDFFAQD